MSEERKPIRGFFVFREGKVIPLDEARKVETHYVITDEIPETWNPADGRYYTSKSRMRQVYRAKGCIEVGNEKFPERKVEHSDPTPALLRAYEEVSKRR
jgi:hypothetical protein